MRTRGEKYETCPHPMGQRWGDKIKQDYESCQQGNKTPPVTMSTDAMDTEEGDARVVQRRSRLSKGWDMESDNVLRSFSVPLPEYEKVDRVVG